MDEVKNDQPESAGCQGGKKEEKPSRTQRRYGEIDEAHQSKHANDKQRCAGEGKWEEWRKFWGAHDLLMIIAHGCTD